MEITEFCSLRLSMTALGLNPCFNGNGSAIDIDGEIFLEGLNPCFNGNGSLAISKMLYNSQLATDLRKKIA